MNKIYVQVKIKCRYLLPFLLFCSCLDDEKKDKNKETLPAPDTSIINKEVNFVRLIVKGGMPGPNGETQSFDQKINIKYLEQVDIDKINAFQIKNKLEPAYADAPSIALYTYKDNTELNLICDNQVGVCIEKYVDYESIYDVYKSFKKKYDPCKLAGGAYKTLTECDGTTSSWCELESDYGCYKHQISFEMTCPPKGSISPLVLCDAEQ